MNNLSDHPIPDSYWVLPGKFLAGQYPASRYFEEETRTKLGNLLQAGVNEFIDLTSPGELPSYQPDLVELSEWYDFKAGYQQVSISDFGIPSPGLMVNILDKLDHFISNGRIPYVHCWAGIGRTGIVVACYLIRHGKAADEALDYIAQQRKGIPSGNHTSPESDIQLNMVKNWRSGE
ncbi:MAG: dual specificity protein phosphatase family protein [Anaerolineaceae bacterium]|nr:dual specificity protein phosphatase family protein [Anaerolineaceae bacterium]